MPESTAPNPDPFPNDIFSDLFQTPAKPASPGDSVIRRAVPTPPPRASGPGTRPAAASKAVEVPAPRCPNTLSETGLNLGPLCEFILKELYIHGSMVGGAMARSMRLPFHIVEEGLRFLKDERCLEVAQGDMLGRISYRFALTDMGRNRAREAFENCRYVGPVPVPLEQYVAQCRQQTVTGVGCTPDALAEAFRGFIMRPGLLDELGPAVCSGRSIFVFGPPGNGKTTIAKGLGQFLNQFCGEIYVPYAIQTENSIITMFDPILHRTTDDAAPLTPQLGAPADKSIVQAEKLVDPRWRRIRRPVVITGGELTLEMLELQFHDVSQIYSAPLHIKANGGVFLIDDFGRQLVSPKDLLNRWILPLEERIDYLTLATGRKFAVPFEQLTIFSTNLDPKDLVDDAFLRRIRHKIRIDPPTRPIFTEIFRQCCQARKVPFAESAVEYLYRNHYDRGRLPRSSDPRDLLEIILAVCRFRNEPVVLSDEQMADSVARFFYSA